jgi:hypothetical protein
MLAIVGLYGLVAYSASRQMRVPEILTPTFPEILAH